MKRHRALGLGIVALAVGLASIPSRGGVAAEEKASPPEVRIGVVASLFRDVPEPATQLLMKPLKSLMQKQTGMVPQVVTGLDAVSLGRQLMDKKVELGVFQGIEFGWARNKYPELKPLMIAVTSQRQFHAYLVVRQDSPAKGFADLKDKTVALPRRSREHCHLFLQRRGQEGGQPGQNFFGKISTPDSSEDALDNVVDGMADAAVVDRVALESYQDRKPGRFKKLRTAQESEPFPAGVIAYRPGALDEATLDRFRDGMLKAHQSSEGKRLLILSQIAGFEQVPAGYEQMLVDIVKAYPPAEAPAQEPKEPKDK